MKEFWNQHKEPVLRVKEAHEKAGLVSHHDLIHAFRVGEMARMIALSEGQDEHTATLAAFAGLSHNADRILQKQKGIGRKQVDPQEIRALICSWIAHILGEEDSDTVTNAVLGHDGKNSAEDSPVLVALMDGDRVVNLDADLVIRSGQFFPNLPPVDYRQWLGDETANYRDPKTVLFDISLSLEWVDPQSPYCVRTQLGKTESERRAAFLRSFIETVRQQLESEGVFAFLSLLDS